MLDYYGDTHRYHHTAPISAFYALRESLALIREEGVDTRFARHRTMHCEFVRRVEAARFSMFIPEEARRITHLNTVSIPGDVDDAKTRKCLIDRHGIDIAGGFRPLAGKIFRIGVLGRLATEENVELLVDAPASCTRKINGFAS